MRAGVEEDTTNCYTTGRHALAGIGHRGLPRRGERASAGTDGLQCDVAQQATKVNNTARMRESAIFR